ncbi:LOW QUALITY PROTEIN: uncharacterized protein LOC142528774 [Primulina tabacum]|uniref:LOW QUALITY PROTEIN: uncharacterized protein LOC142528774 n=1 Tax=Primulina tabacum TaxID=48773 RepID=UPI003F593CCD
MPGNEFGDRVHNFFAQDNTFQVQPESLVVEGNWPVLSNNFWIGSQRQAEALHSNNKTYNIQDPDIDRGQESYPFHVTQGLNFAQSNVRADFSKSQSLNEQPNLNGYMFGNQFHLSRQNAANFLAVDTDSETHHVITSRGFSVHELQQGSGIENGAKTSLRSETSVPSVSLDLFGGQQQMSQHQSSMLLPVQHQHPGINNMQQQQQQLMIRKMQDLQRQQQFHPLEIRQQNHINQVPAFIKQASGSHSTPIDGNLVSDLQQYPWTTDVGTNWMNRGSLSMQGPQTGLVFPPNLGQTQHLVDLVSQPVDQSLYGIPVSGSRGLNANQYPHKVNDRSPILQMSTPSNTLQGNHNFFADQVGVNDDDSIARQKFQNENIIGHTSSQSLFTGPIDIGSLQQVNSIQRNAPQDFLGRQELTIRPETPSEKSMRPAVTSCDEVALDPAEEKILFGSDDNIFAAFGNAANMSGESGNLFDNGETLNGFPSIHSGSWSALMQSAVAETSSNDMVPQEEWSGLIFHNVNGSSANQSPSVHNNNVKRQSSLVDKTRMPSAPSPGSIPHSGDSNANNVTGFNLLGHRFLNEPGQRVPNEVPERIISLEEANKWSNYIPPQKSLAEDSQIYRDASQRSPEAGMSAMKISSPWVHQQSGSQQQSNGRNTPVAIPTAGDRGLNVHQAEKLSQNSKSNQLRVIQGEAVGGSLWKSNSVSRSATELGHAKPTIGNPETNKVTLSLNDAAPVANSYSVGVADETNPFFHDSHKINQWKNSNSSTIYQGGKDLGRTPHQAIEQNQGLDSFSCEKEEVPRREMENYDMKENSNDSHRSNLSGHTCGGFRETGSGPSDSKSLPPANQKSTNQLFRKVSVPRKFQYHPMANSDEDAEPSYHLKQSTNLQAMSQPNSYLDQSNFLLQYPINSKVNEKGQGQSSELQKHNKVTNEEPPHGGLPGYAPTMSVSYTRPFDSFSPNTVSSSGQNMLELLPKVDQSRGHDDTMHLSSEGKVSPQLPDAEKVDGTAGFFQQNQSSVYQGFGLQLGPPSLQRGQIPDHSASQKAQNTVSSVPISHATAEMGERGQRMVTTSTTQSLNFPNGEFQAEFKNNRPAVPPRHAGSNERLRNFQEAFSSGPPHVSQLQNQQVMRSSGKINMNQDVDSSFSSDVSNNIQRGSMEKVLPDTPGDIKKANVMSSRGMTQQAGPNDSVHERGPTSTASGRDPFHASQHFSMQGISHQGSPLNALHNLTTNVYTNQHSLGSQYQKASSQFPDITQPNTEGTKFCSPVSRQYECFKVRDLPSDLRSIYVNSSGIVDGEEQRSKESAGQSLSSVRVDPSNKNHSDDSPANLSSAQKNIEAFGRSLKPNSFSHQNHASQNQINALKDAGADPSCRVSKRMKGPDDCLDVDRVASTAGQQNDHGLVLGDSLGSSTGVPSDDLRMPRVLLSADALNINPSQQGNVAPQDILSRGANVSHSNSSTDYTTSVRAEYPEVSPQMAPSWFNQYGTFKNGQMLHSYNSHKLIPSKSGELGKSLSVMDTLGSEDKGTDAPTDACHVYTTHQTSTSTFVNVPLSSGRLYELNATDQNLVISRPKKRKTATSQLQPWHKEIADGSQNLSTLSVAETVWSQVANRVREKVDDDPELIEDGPPFLRSKRRLILTTQLMQQLFYPPPAGILSADASFKCVSVAYAVSRTMLGNVCSAVFCSSGLDLPRDGVELLSAKGKSSDRNVDQYSGKVMECLMGRLGKLENDFLRLEKSSSIFDVRMECQDLEKFSVINRLAEFHGRGQTDVSDTAPSHKPLPQRYVAAIPMPKSLPDRVQCLSL